MRRLIYIALVCTVATSFFAHITFAQTTSGVNLIDNVLQQLTDIASSTASSIPTGFSRDGVFGCTGASYGAVGMQGPSGSHVPTFDDANHDQQRLLTYKECLLDGVTNSMRETLVSFLIKSVVRWTNQGLDGNPVYITNLPLHMTEKVADPVAERILTGPETEVIAGPFRRDVRVALAKNYATERNAPETKLGCSLSDDKLNSLSSGDFFGAGGWESFYTFVLEPSCNPLFAYYNANNYLNKAISAEQNREQTEIDWALGVQSIKNTETIDLGGGQSTTISRIVTPGFMIADHLRQTIGTGLRQAENADEIDEIISALMSNIGTKMLTDIRGLAGLSSSFNGQAAYVDRLAEESAARTRGNMTGAAASLVNNTIRIEQEYAQARQDSANTLAQSRRQLESWERTCWSGLIDQAKADLRARVEARVCDQQGSTSTSCGVTVSVTESIARDTLAIHVPSVGKITVQGRATNGGSSVKVVATNEGESVGPEQPTVGTNGNWVTDQMSMVTIPDGTISISATETLSGGSGALAPLTAEVQKETTVTGIELTPPATFPALTITASAGGFTETATIATSTSRSRSVTNQSIKPILDLLRENIYRSGKALEVLDQIRDALASTASASGQRFILERLDQLVAARVLHTESQLRQAQDQVGEIEAAMQQLLEETRDNWEAGWCDPDNWEQYTN